jgi:hypothetical protein
VLAIAAALLLLPLAVSEADPIAGVTGGLVGLGAGSLIEALRPGR